MRTQNAQAAVGRLGRRSHHRATCLLACLLIVGNPVLTCWGENPAGGQFAAGGGSISSVGDTLNVATTTARSVIDWQSFSISDGFTTNITQPTSASAVLNRVVAPGVPSVIQGTLQSNGNVYLVNPSGVVVGPTGVVTTNGFTASVLDISNDQFMRGGNLEFSGSSTAGIVNQGTISTGNGGAALIAPMIDNSGVIESNGGSISLVTGGSVELADGSRFVHADRATIESGLSPTAPLIRNSGTVRATGALKAGGEVYLVSPGGTVMQQGLVAASQSSGSTVTGGRVVATGESVVLDGEIDVTGLDGGGDAFIGGGIRGDDPSIANAASTVVMKEASIAADATRNGDGGTVVIWSDGETDFAGTITAIGAGLTGLGGFVEVSGKETLLFNGLVNTGGGQLLLDPFNYVIGVAEAANIVAALVGNNVTIQTNSDAPAFGSSGNAADDGDIIVNAPINWSSVFDLTFLAEGDIQFNASVQNDLDVGGGDVNVVAGWDGTTAFDAAVLQAADVTSTTIYGNGGGSVSVGNGTQTSGVAVGVRSGQTNVFGQNVSVIGSNVSGGHAQIGFKTSNAGFFSPLTGEINVRARNALDVQGGSGMQAFAQVGHVGGDFSFNQTADSRVTGDITVSTGGDITFASGTGGTDAYSQLGHGGSRATGDRIGNITIVNANDISFTGGGTEGTYSHLGHGGQGAPGDLSGSITVQQARSLSLTAGTNETAYAQMGNGGFGTDGSKSGVIDATLSGQLTLLGRNLLDRYVLLGHGDEPGDGDVENPVRDDVILRIGQGISMANAVIGHWVDESEFYASGNTFVAIGQNNYRPSNSTDTLTSDANSLFFSAQRAAAGELRFYLPNRAAFQVDNNAQLNGVARSVAAGATPFQNEVGNFTPFNGGYLGTTADNYSFYFPELVNIVVRALSGSSIYGEVPGNPGLQLESGTLYAGDNVNNIGLTTNFNLTQTSPVGNTVLVVDPTNLSPDYNLQSTIDGLFTINPAPLTITANDQTKVYGTMFVFNGSEFTTAGLQNGETVGSVTLDSAATPATAAVGDYPIVPSNATGGTFNPTNYTITYVNGNFAVTPAPLTITADDQSKVYGTTLSFNGTEFTTSGLQNGETVGSVTLDSAATPATASVGDYPIVPSNATGGTFNPTNYVITYVNGNFAVTPAPLTVTADDQAKVYGTTFSFNGTEFTTSGLQNGETVGSVTLDSAATPATASVGDYPIVPSNATGGTFSPTNYTITYVNGNFVVTPAPLTVTANDQTKVYGTAFSFNGAEFTTSGLQNGETVGSVTLDSAATPATASVGDYPVVPSNATGGTFNPTNYTITYVNGNFAVTPAPLTITANDQSKVYGTMFSFNGTEFTSAGLQNGETVGTVTLSSAATPATAPVGDYPIVPSNASGGTFNPANYTITYVNGNFAVTPAPLTITADDQTKVFGDTFVFAGSEFTAAGLQNGDVIDTATLSSQGAPPSAAPGNYPITVAAPTGANFDVNNYVVTFVDGNLEVTGTTVVTPPVYDLFGRYDGWWRTLLPLLPDHVGCIFVCPDGAFVISRGAAGTTAELDVLLIQPVVDGARAYPGPTTERCIGKPGCGVSIAPVE